MDCSNAKVGRRHGLLTRQQGIDFQVRWQTLNAVYTTSGDPAFENNCEWTCADGYNKTFTEGRYQCTVYNPSAAQLRNHDTRIPAAAGGYVLFRESGQLHMGGSERT